jgi:hypothetical protein
MRIVSYFLLKGFMPCRRTELREGTSTASFRMSMSCWKRRRGAGKHLLQQRKRNIGCFEAFLLCWLAEP